MDKCPPAVEALPSIGPYLKCAAHACGVAAILSIGMIASACAQDRSRTPESVSCRPKDVQGSFLPYSAGDPTLRCEMHLIWQKDCATSDPVKMYYRPYCLNLARERP